MKIFPYLYFYLLQSSEWAVNFFFTCKRKVYLKNIKCILSKLVNKGAVIEIYTSEVHGFSQGID